MDKKLIFITEDITMGDLETGRISSVQVYKKQMTNWLFRPARHLAEMKGDKFNNYENGIALFVLLLTFFESHGQYISGIDSNGKSRQIFRSGFQRFANYITIKNKVDSCFAEFDSSKLYDWARNGLFHNGYIKNGLLVDITKRKKLVFYKDIRFDGWLVDPWIMLDEMESYFTEYMNILEDLSNVEYADLKNNFDKTFERFYKIDI